MPLGKKQQRLGDLTKDDINFPKHLTPEIIHSALFVHNANSKQETMTRIDYLAKQIGEEAMSYVMSLLVLPTLMEMTRDTTEYKTFLDGRNSRTIN